jgi:hypothetical protein
MEVSMSKLSKPNVGLAEARPFAGMSQVHAQAAGVDIGTHEIMVCVQGGLLTTSDLSVLFHHGHSRVAELIRAYETQSGDVVPRRGNLHDMGRTVTHKRIICHKAFLEGKTTDVIAPETNHSPEAVDHYLLDFSRVYYATVLKGMSIEEATFAIQRPRSLVEEYVKLLVEFGLNNQRLLERIQIQLERCKTKILETQRAQQQPEVE